MTNMKAPRRRSENSQGHIPINVRGCPSVHVCPPRAGNSPRSDLAPTQHRLGVACCQTPFSHSVPPWGGQGGQPCSGTASLRALPSVTRCQQRNWGLSLGLCGSNAPALPSKRWGGSRSHWASRPSLRPICMLSQRGALPWGSEEGRAATCSSLRRKPPFPAPPPPPPRSSGAQAQTSRDLAQPNGRCGAWGRSVTQSKRPWARCRRRGEGVGEGKVDGGCKDSNYINIFPFRRAVASTPQSNLPNTFGAHQGPGGAGRGTDLSEAKDRLCPPKADGLTGSPWG